MTESHDWVTIVMTFSKNEHFNKKEKSLSPHNNCSFSTRIILKEISFHFAKLFLLLWQKSKWQKMSIYKCEKKLPSDFENYLPFELTPAMFFSYLWQKLKNKHWQRVSKWSKSSGKYFSHLKIDIFCHFDFCHNRRNSFSLTQDSQSESAASVVYIERMDLSHYSSLVLKMGVRGAGSSLVPKRANCQVLQFFQDLSLGLGI